MHFISIDANCEGAKNEGAYGFLYNTQQPNTVALKRYYNPSTQDHMVVAGGTSLGGYSLEGILGYAP